MINLEQFYYQIICKIPPLDRYFSIQELEDVIVVNFDCMYEKECNLRATDQLIYLLHKIGDQKRFLFLTEDGANIKLSGAAELIENIVDVFNLNEDTCALVCNEQINIPNVNVIFQDFVKYWVKTIYPIIKDIPIPNGPFTKKFAVWFHRGTFYRFLLAKHLYDNYQQDSYISYQEHGILIDRKLDEYFSTEASWAKSHTPIVYDQLFTNRVYTHDMIVGAKRKPYNNYFLEIVGEVDILSNNHLSEKTLKNLYIGKPFLLMGGVESLKKLRSYGFKTFSPWIDESYDTVSNIHQRLELIKREIDRIGTLSYQELNQLYKEMLPIFCHNRQQYINLVKKY
jgi:hypothetical protein